MNIPAGEYCLTARFAKQSTILLSSKEDRWTKIPADRIQAWVEGDIDKRTSRLYEVAEAAPNGCEFVYYGY